jgi:hypothetical protein
MAAPKMQRISLRKLAVDTVGATRGYRRLFGTIVPRWSAPGGGSAKRPSGRSINLNCLTENFWAMGDLNVLCLIKKRNGAAAY